MSSNQHVNTKNFNEKHFQDNSNNAVSWLILITTLDYYFLALSFLLTYLKYGKSLTNNAV